MSRPKGLIDTKMVVSVKGFGRTSVTCHTTWGLCKHPEYSAILMLEYDGKSMQNEWGGHPVRNTGAKSYIARIWRSL